MGDLLIERDRARGCILLPVSAKRRGPQQLHGAPPDSDPEVWWNSLTESAGTRRPRKLASEVVFCFPALRFDAFSPYRDSRYCCAPKPGKEKHKSYHYRSGILMVHRFRSFLSVFTPVMRKIWREVTRNLADQFEALGAFAKRCHRCKNSWLFLAIVRCPCDAYAKPKYRSHVRQARVLSLFTA